MEIMRQKLILTEDLTGFGHPLVGVGLGFQVTRVFSIGFEHKITFPFTDTFDGQEWNEANMRTGKNDFYHYSNLWMGFGFGGGGRGRTGTDPNPNPNPNNYTSTRTPTIRLTSPPTSSYNAGPGCRSEIRANISNISGSASIQFKHNGQFVPQRNFGYNISTKVFFATVNLFPGQNNFEIIASNRDGRDISRFTIVCPEPSGQGPTVNITFPSTPTYDVGADCRGNIIGYVKGVTSKSQISFFHNGSPQNRNNFAWNPGNGEFSANVTLTGGQNNFEIRATNGFGTASDRVTLTCGNVVTGGRPPVVKVVDPNGGNYNGTNCNPLIRVRIQNINSKQNIKVTENGVLVLPSRYSWDPSTNMVTMSVSLQQGVSRRFNFSATNNFGSDQDMATVRCYSVNSWDPQVTICHFPPSDPLNPQTITIPQNQWATSPGARRYSGGLVI